MDELINITIKTLANCRPALAVFSVLTFCSIVVKGVVIIIKAGCKGLWDIKHEYRLGQIRETEDRLRVKEKREALEQSEINLLPEKQEPDEEILAE